MKYVDFDPVTGKILGFYSSDVHGERTIQVAEDSKVAPMLTVVNYDDPANPVSQVIPNPEFRLVVADNPKCIVPARALEITDEQWQDCLDHQGERMIRDGQIVPCAAYNSTPL